MYVTSSYRLTPRSTECKYLLKDLAFNSRQDRICLRNSLGGGANPFSAIRLWGLLVKILMILDSGTKTWNHELEILIYRQLHHCSVLFYRAWRTEVIPKRMKRTCCIRFFVATVTIVACYYSVDFYMYILNTHRALSPYNTYIAGRVYCHSRNMGSVILSVYVLL